MRLILIATLAFVSPVTALAQDQMSGMAGMAGMDHGAMPGMNHDHDADHTSAMPPMTGEGSGTARLPANEAMSGIMLPSGERDSLMLHGYVWPIYTRQTGPRGGDKLYAQSMAMAAWTHSFGGASLTGRAMLSLEPAMRHDGYPLLFATGETAYGASLVDRQHPHDLFMELTARLEVPMDGTRRLFLYGGPVGEPALGPSAFLHRASARLNPEAPITHHWFDSTHITYGVVTAGIGAGGWQLEASAFRGQEPDERRWNIETPRLDSWSVRATITPSPAWAFQTSYGRLKQPEASHPGENERRFTASAHYNDGKGLSAMLAFSAKTRVPGGTRTAWLGEANWDLSAHHTLFGRIENVANDELFPDHANPLHDRPFRITKLQAGYAWRTPLAGPVHVALGGSLAMFAKPAVLDAAYGRNPVGGTLFAKFSLGD